MKKIFGVAGARLSGEDLKTVQRLAVAENTSVSALLKAALTRYSIYRAQQLRRTIDRGLTIRGGNFETRKNVLNGVEYLQERATLYTDLAEKLNK